MSDWPTHRHACDSICDKGSMTAVATDKGHPVENTNKEQPRPTDKSQPGLRRPGQQSLQIDEGGSQQLQIPLSDKNIGGPTPSYLNNDKVLYDVPTCSKATGQTFEITVKANREKLKIPIHSSWDGNEIMKYLSHALRIPLDKLKVIHKGKYCTSEIILGVVQKDTAVLMVLGERAEDCEGLEPKDVDILMKQVTVGRNDAIRALKHTRGDLVDAILHLPNK